MRKALTLELNDELFENPAMFTGVGILNDTSIRQIMPEYKDDYANCTELYREWLFENEKTGISKTRFVQDHYGKSWNTIQTPQETVLCRKRDENFQKLFNAFVKENRDLIIEAQNKKISECNEKNKEYITSYDKKEKEKFYKEHEQVLTGKPLAVSTLQKDNTIKEINNLLSIGYKVQSASASMVFLEYTKEEPPLEKEVQNIYGFNPSTPSSGPYELRHVTVNVKGVDFPVLWKLKDAEYIQLEYMDEERNLSPFFIKAW